MRYNVKMTGDWEIDSTVPDGQQHGYDVEGRLICVVQFEPVYKMLMGDYDAAEFVHRWHLSPAFYAVMQKRLQYAAAAYRWKLEGYPTEGMA